MMQMLHHSTLQQICIVSNNTDEPAVMFLFKKLKTFSRPPFGFSVISFIVSDHGSVTLFRYNPSEHYGNIQTANQMY